MNSSERKRKTKDHVYATKGKGPCPYEPDTMEHKHWHRVQRHYWSMESHFDDLAEAYGEFRPDRITK
jgi:hypothetical protein